jgi:putative hydrolase of the HAD superfamily
MGVGAEDAVHVGDLPEADGEGAESAGIRPIIIDRNDCLDECQFERVTLLTDLVSLL